MGYSESRAKGECLAINIKKQERSQLDNLTF